MTEAEAQDKLALMVMADEDPELSEPQLADLVERARRPDTEGHTYPEDAWTPTWDLDAAAAEGWRRKASLAVARFDFAEDTQTFSRSQIYSHCIAQAEEYGRRSMGAIKVLGGTAAYELPGLPT
jgi:hypothetical protein